MLDITSGSLTLAVKHPPPTRHNPIDKLNTANRGKLPAHLAILLNTTARIENLVVEACMEKSRKKVFEAVCFDPLTSAVCSLAEIRSMVDELFAYNKDFLADYT